MHTAQHQVASATLGAPLHGLTVGATVAIYSSYSSKQIGTGTVVRVLSRWVLVQSSSWRTSVKFRTCAPLRGHRITGGVAEHLNEWIVVPSSADNLIASRSSDKPTV